MAVLFVRCDWALLDLHARDIVQIVFMYCLFLGLVPCVGAIIFSIYI